MRFERLPSDKTIQYLKPVFSSYPLSEIYSLEAVLATYYMMSSTV